MTEPCILALDTTTEACSVALARAGRTIARWKRLPRGHSARILPMVEEVLAEAECGLRDLDALAFCRGPGSFTGVRICAGVVQGLAYAADRPVIPVSTLAVIAQGVHRDSGAAAVLTAIDARMGQVYWGVFGLGDGGFMVPLAEEAVRDPGSVEAPEEGEWTGAGTGFGAHGAILRERLGPRLSRTEPERLPRAEDGLPEARARLAAGRVVPAAGAVPVYLRDRVTG